MEDAEQRIATARGTTPPPTAAPDELAGRPLGLADLQAPPEVRIDDRTPDVRQTLYLTGDMNTIAWRINAKTYNADRPFPRGHSTDSSTQAYSESG